MGQKVKQRCEKIKGANTHLGEYYFEFLPLKNTNFCPAQSQGVKQKLKEKKKKDKLVTHWWSFTATD